MSVVTDGGVAIGAAGEGMRPMELVLAAVANCSAIDILLLLEKQRQDVVDLKITVTGQRAETVPKVFTRIRVHYDFVGELNAKKVERACRLSMEKLCSVSMMLKAGGVAIEWDYSIEATA